MCNTTMFMGVCETRTLAPPADTQEGRGEAKCSCFFRERKNVKCKEQNPRKEGGVVLGLIFATRYRLFLSLIHI